MSSRERVASTSASSPRPAEDEWEDITDRFRAAVQQLPAAEVVYDAGNFSWSRCMTAAELTELDEQSVQRAGRCYDACVRGGLVPDTVSELYAPHLILSAAAGGSASGELTYQRGARAGTALPIVEGIFTLLMSWLDGRRGLAESLLPSLHLHKYLLRQESLGTALMRYVVRTCLACVRTVQRVVAEAGVYFEEDIALRSSGLRLEECRLDDEWDGVGGTSAENGNADLTAAFTQAMEEVSRECAEDEADEEHRRILETLRAMLQTWRYLYLLLRGSHPTAVWRGHAQNLQRHLQYSVEHLHLSRRPLALPSVGFDSGVVRHRMPATPPRSIQLMTASEAQVYALQIAEQMIAVSEALQWLASWWQLPSPPPPETSAADWLGRILTVLDACAMLSNRTRPQILARSVLCIALETAMPENDMTLAGVEVLNAQTNGEDSKAPDVQSVCRELQNVAATAVRVMCMNRGRQRRRLVRVIQRLHVVRCRVVSANAERRSLLLALCDALAAQCLCRHIRLGFELELYHEAELDYVLAQEVFGRRLLIKALEHSVNGRERWRGLHLLQLLRFQRSSAAMAMRLAGKAELAVVVALKPRRRPVDERLAHWQRFGFVPEGWRLSYEAFLEKRKRLREVDGEVLRRRMSEQEERVREMMADDALKAVREWVAYREELEEIEREVG
ncbi:hypothetical protein CDCA_CDCA04G1399 [Cyanidium caldarium]|uniref:NAA35-like TPR repeats domain-containing protein n=1 Tax=Cyanidium caldarium TaxID=2771 RepID=A0AAV9IT07_CYACA|nr:hypothetical protein CDCA_CDCA04G1399 [Cyanidium caldarium]